MRVSVIMPVYNARPFLERSISSVLMQKEVVELICVDDGSTDGSYEFIKEWADQESRIRLFQHDKGERKRAAASRNLGLKKAKGEFISFLDADDEYLEGRFTVAKKLYPRERFDLLIEKVVMMPKVQRNEDRFIEVKNENHLFRNVLLARNGYIFINGILLHSSLIRNVGNFDNQLVQFQDKDFILRAILNSKTTVVDYSKEPIAYYWKHLDNTTRNHRERLRYKSTFYKKWVKIITQIELSYWDKVLFIYDYTVVTNKTINYWLALKIVVYPFLLILNLFRFRKIFYKK